MSDWIYEDGPDAVAVAVLEQILRGWAAAGAALSPDGGPDLVQPVTEVARGSYRFAALHFFDVRVDEFVEVVPVRFCATVVPARGEGFRVLIDCHTNLEEPEYAYWEFRDFLKGLQANGYLGCFSLGDSPWHTHERSHQVLCYQYRFPVPRNGAPACLAESLLRGVIDDILHAAISFFQHFWYYLELDGTCSRHGGDDPKGPGGPPSRIIPFPAHRRNRLS